MLTEKQYQALCRYRDSFVPASGKPDDAATYFFDRGFIKIERFEYSVKGECETFYLKTMWVLTMPGKLALEEFEEHQKQLAEERSQKTRDRAFEIFLVFLSIFFTIIAGFLVDWVFTLFA